MDARVVCTDAFGLPARAALPVASTSSKLAAGTENSR